MLGYWLATANYRLGLSLGLLVLVEIGWARKRDLCCWETGIALPTGGFGPTVGKLGVGRETGMSERIGKRESGKLGMRWEVNKSQLPKFPPLYSLPHSRLPTEGISFPGLP